MDVSELEKVMYGDVENDPELLRELAALEAQEEQTPANNTRNVPPARRAAPGTSSGVDFSEINKLARQISREATVNDDDDDPSVEQDEDLLDELQDLLLDAAPRPKPPPTMPKSSSSGAKSGVLNDLQQRLAKYDETIENAKKEGNDRRVRQTERIQKQYRQAITSYKSGRSVNLEELPVPPGFEQLSAAPTDQKPIEQKAPVPQPATPPAPKIAPKVAERTPEPISPPPAVPVRQAPNLPKIPTHAAPPQTAAAKTSSDDILGQLKQAALDAKRRGDMDTAKDLMRQIKQITAPRISTESPTSAAPPPPPVKPQVSVQSDSGKSMVRRSSSEPRLAEQEASSPTTVLGALEERLNKYKETIQKAKNEGNDRRVRQSERIAKQYMQAIRSHKAGKAVDFDELPVPPGFGPIPKEDKQPTKTALPPPDAPQRKLSGPPTPVPQVPVAATVTPSPPRRPAQSPTEGGPSPPKQSKQEQQLEFLLNREKQFKEAALLAKRKGNIDMAKQYLKSAKGLEPMIEASRNGLPVNISGIPQPPQQRTDKRTLESQLGTDKTSPLMANKSNEEIYAQLEQDLIRQVQICERNKEYFTKLGDVPQVSKFEKWCDAAKRDLMTLRQAAKRKDPLPRFRYEYRVFPSLDSHPDLGESDLELLVVRGIGLKPPDGYEEKHADFFVKYEFPFPQDHSQTGKTANVAESLSPAFNERSLLKINRKSRQFQRTIKRHGVKLEVFQKGGFLRSDKSVGSCELKTADLESAAQVHQSVDLLQGRRPCGGKLEVKVRIRDPLNPATTKEISEKWLVIDSFARVQQPQPKVAAKPVVLPKVPTGSKPVLPKIPVDKPKGLRRMYDTEEQRR